MSSRFVVGRSQSSDVSVDCDVCIVGSGAGGAVAAAILAQAGLSVVVLEAGGWNRRDRFTMQEQDTYPLLYQESMRRATADQAISILQGRTVGGGTVVNWTTTFRTPSHVLEHWRKRFGLTEYTDAELKPHFDAIEGRLGVSDVPEDQINANNRRLWEGTGALGWERSLLRRNVRGCRQSGYCGMGCAFDAKQSALLTFLDDAVGAGALVVSDCHAHRLTYAGDRIVEVHGVFQNPERGEVPTGLRATVRWYLDHRAWCDDIHNRVYRRERIGLGELECGGEGGEALSGRRGQQAASHHVHTTHSGHARDGVRDRHQRRVERVRES